MDNQIAWMLNDGWDILAQTPHSGDSRGFRPFAKRGASEVLNMRSEAQDRPRSLRSSFKADS
jgi:hypothetical protein